VRLQGHGEQAILRRLSQPAVMRRRASGVAVSVMLALLAGCTGSRDSSKANCPTALTAPDLDTYRALRQGATSADDVQFGVKLTAVKATCQPEKGGLRVDTAISFIVARPNLRQPGGDFTYFVAIADPARTIVAKQYFALRADFSPKQSQLQVVDTITEHLPLRDVATAGDYAVIVGLQLTQDQLDSNRQRNAPAQ
jgi:hypothetical protein